MATKVYMEALSPTMEEGRLVKWNRSEGDAIKSGDVLAEVETDKAVMELVARGDGILRKRLVAEGATAPVGQLVGVIAAAGEDIAALIAAAAPVADPSAAPAAAPPSAPAAAPAAATAATPVTTAGALVAHAPDIDPVSEQAPHAAEVHDVRSSPLARRLAREGGLDLAALRGTGPGGRIIKRDVESALRAPLASAASAAPVVPVVPVVPAVPAGSRPVVAAGADFEDVPLTQIRKTIARRLTESLGPIPTFYLTAEFDLTSVTELRGAMASYGDEFRVSVNDVIMKAVATALVQHPECNAHWLGDRVRYFSRVHLGMAVATDDGLIVPVLFDADRKSLREIAAGARALAERARARKLNPEEYTGSTFSVSNLGMLGIDQFTAIINPPECGILAIGTVSMQPMLIDGAQQWRQRLRVTMSCDHRVIDGAVGARFLQTLRRLLENPLMLAY